MALRNLFVGLIFALTLFGVAMIYSAGVLHGPDTSATGAWARQALWTGISILAFLAVTQVPFNWLRWSAKGAYGLSMTLLAATLVVGTGRGTAVGVKSWIDLGPIGFQPSEIAKVATIAFLASYLSDRKQRKARPSMQDLVVPGMIGALPLGLVMLQPDIGTALAFVGIMLAALVWAGMPPIQLAFATCPILGFVLGSTSTLLWAVYMVALVLFLLWREKRLETRSLLSAALVFSANFLAGATARPLWNSLQGYQKNRIRVWLDPTVDPSGVGYQLLQSKAAIGAGGLTGQGFAQGAQKELGFLPEQHTDFIFSVVGEELGFLGASAAVIALCGVVFLQLRMAARSKDLFGRLVLSGVAGMWFVHIFVNVGMTMGVTPITGIPLPFLSYGGTFLLMSWVAAAICWRVAEERPT
ncbi:MAG: rod shape-determining protein RodA [Gemmatimonadetes bacterium]|nr:rod shape-determining protein RodA [Gemmatimonadota bacterium]